MRETPDPARKERPNREGRIDRLAQLGMQGPPDARSVRITRALAATGRRMTPGTEWVLSVSADEKAAAGMTAREWRACEAAWAAERPCDPALPHADEPNRLEQAIANLQDTGLWPWEPQRRPPKAAGSHGPHRARDKQGKRDRQGGRAYMSEREIARTLSNVPRISTRELAEIDELLHNLHGNIVAKARTTYQTMGRGAVLVDLPGLARGVAPSYMLQEALRGEGTGPNPFAAVAAAVDDYDPEREAVALFSLDSVTLAYRVGSERQEQRRYDPFTVM